MSDKCEHKIYKVKQTKFCNCEDIRRKGIKVFADRVEKKFRQKLDGGWQYTISENEWLALRKEFGIQKDSSNSPQGSRSS